MDSVKNTIIEQEQKEVEVDILSIIVMLLRKIWLILLAGVIVGAGAFAFAKFVITPTYRTYFSAYVNNSQTAAQQNRGLTSADVLAARELVQTYSQILTSDKVLTASADGINLDLSYKQLRKMVYTSIQDDTEIINVYVVSSDPQLAYDLANSIAHVAPTYMSSIVEGSSMKIIDYARFPDDIFKPNAFKYMLIGAAIGMLLMIIILIIRNFTDDTIKSEADLEKQFSIPVVGLIPDINTIRATGSAAYSSDYSYGQAGPRHSKEDK